MNKRIQQFLELEDLTPAKLSEILGIQRSGLSHILAGRNKPSFDFIERMLTKFPTLSAEWLITGKGKPYKEQNTIFSQPSVQPQTPPQITLNQPVIPQNESSQPHENQLFDISPVNDPPIISPKEDIDDHPKSNRTITRITVFYSDGTFEER